MNIWRRISLISPINQNSSMLWNTWEACTQWWTVMHRLNYAYIFQLLCWQLPSHCDQVEATRKGTQLRPWNSTRLLTWTPLTETSQLSMTTTNGQSVSGNISIGWPRIHWHCVLFYPRRKRPGDSCLHTGLGGIYGTSTGNVNRPILPYWCCAWQWLIGRQMSFLGLVLGQTIMAHHCSVDEGVSAVADSSRHAEISSSGSLWYTKGQIQLAPISDNQETPISTKRSTQAWAPRGVGSVCEWKILMEKDWPNYGAELYKPRTKHVKPIWFEWNIPKKIKVILMSQCK